MISAVRNHFKYSQNAPFIVLVFIFFSAVPNSFECRQNAPFSVLVFIFFSLQFQIVSNADRMHHLASLFSTFSLQFQIVSNIRLCTCITKTSFFVSHIDTIRFILRTFIMGTYIIHNLYFNKYFT